MFDTIRRIYSWLFLVWSMLSLWLGFEVIKHMIQRHHPFLPPQNLLLAPFYPLLACTLAVAWWTIWKRKRSGKTWGMVASITYILFSHFREPWHHPHTAVTTVIGVVGLAAFMWQDDNRALETAIE